jgi:hypothetical protein
LVVAAFGQFTEELVVAVVVVLRATKEVAEKEVAVTPALPERRPSEPTPPEELPLPEPIDNLPEW